MSLVLPFLACCGRGDHCFWGDICEYFVVTGFYSDSLRGSVPRPGWDEEETTRDRKILGGSHLSTRRDKRHQ